MNAINNGESRSASKSTKAYGGHQSALSQKIKLYNNVTKAGSRHQSTQNSIHK